MGSYYSVIGLALTVAVFGVIANHAREMYRDKKYREMFGTLFWAIVPMAGFAIFWVVNENPSTMGRNILLGIVGAGLGAVALIWAGYVAHDWSVHAQTPVGNVAMTTRDTLAGALDDLASAIAGAPPVVIGSRTVVTAGPGSSGTVIGKQVTVTAGPGSHGTIIGEQTTVTAGRPNGTQPINGTVADHLRDGAMRVRNGDATRGLVQGLLAEATLPGAPANVQAAIATANQALTASDLR